MKPTGPHRLGKRQVRCPEATKLDAFCRLAGLRGHEQVMEVMSGTLPNQFTCVSWIWRRRLTAFFGVSQGRGGGVRMAVFQDFIGCWAPYCRLSSPYTNGAGAWFMQFIRSACSPARFRRFIRDTYSPLPIYATS